MTEPLIDRLDDVWADIISLCDDLSDAQWDLPTECPGWTVKDNVAHMIGTERMLLGEQAPPADISGAAHIRNDIGKANETWIESYRALTGKEVLDEFRSVTARRLDVLRAMTPEDWTREGFTPEGPGPYSQFMEIRVFDCWYHDQDIREAIDRPGFMHGAVAELSVGRIPARGLGYVVGKKAAAPPGSTVVFEVAGPPDLVVAIGVPPEGRAGMVDPISASPTVRVTTDRRTFARLAGGRWNADDARARGTVRVEGDRELGARVVENMAFTI